MMKIAYCIDSITAWGGIERVTLSKANALAEIDGNIIYFFVVTNKGIPVFPVNSKIQIINLDVDYDAAKGLARLKSEIVFRRKKYEHKVKLIGKLNSIQPDIVVSTGQAEKHFIRSLQLNYNPVLIKEIHFSSDFRLIEASSFKERVYANIAQFLDNHWNIRKFDRVVVLTEEDIQKNWRKYKNVVVIPNPLTKNCNIESSNVSSNKVIAAGRLVRQKNFDSLINAWSYVFEKHPDWKLEIYGDGYLKDFLSKQINILKLNSSIFLKGLSNDIFEKMSHSSIFVLSSIYEGFGLVIVEAMSCGLPVVSYACPCGPKDIIEEGKDGFLVEVNDEQTLAARINQLIEDEELRRQMSKAALQKSEKYKMERIIPMWMDLFEKLKREKG